MSYDFITGRTVLFGGRPKSGAFLADTWEYDGKNWAQLTTAGAPPGRYLSEMVYVRGRLYSLLFGGLGTGSTYLNDTWVWDSIKKTWTQKLPKSSPIGRYNPALAYDSARDRVVLFGGRARTAYMNDTWEWDGTNWMQMNPANKPAARYTAMTYDAARKRVVLYGGSNSAYDTWEYDGNNWTQVKPANRPTARCCVAMAYDLVRKRVVVFGGFSPNNNETWEYDGNNWTQIKPPTSPPARRDFDNMVYDSRRARMVLFGGLGTTQMADTWEYVGTLPLTASPATISIATGGTQTFTLNAGSQHGSRLYWLFGSLTGTSPGVTLISAVGAVTIPLVPDFYTTITIAQPNTAFLGGAEDQRPERHRRDLLPRVSGLRHEQQLPPGQQPGDVAAGEVGGPRAAKGPTCPRLVGSPRSGRNRSQENHHAIPRSFSHSCRPHPVIAVPGTDLDPDPDHERAFASLGARDVLRLHQRPHRALWRQAPERRLPVRHLGVRRQELDAGDHHDFASGTLPERDGLRQGRPALPTVWRAWSR
jgi:hypothetical protein